MTWGEAKQRAKNRTRWRTEVDAYVPLGTNEEEVKGGKEAKGVSSFSSHGSSRFVLVTSPRKLRLLFSVGLAPSRCEAPEQEAASHQQLGNKDKEESLACKALYLMSSFNLSTIKKCPSSL